MVVLCRVVESGYDERHAGLLESPRRGNTKAGVTAGSTVEPGWAAPLAPVRPLMEAFVEMSRPASLIGKLLPLSKQVPFAVSDSDGHRWRDIPLGRASCAKLIGRATTSPAT